MGVVQYGTDLPRVVAIPKTSSLTRWASMSSFLILKNFATILYFSKEIIFNHIYYNWLMLTGTELEKTEIRRIFANLTKLGFWR